MNTINLSNKQIKNMTKMNDFNHSKLLRCHIEVKGVPVVFNKPNSFRHVFKQLLLHYEPDEITNVSKRFNKLKTKSANSYKYDADLKLWIPILNITAIVRYMAEFMKYKNIKHDLIFRMQNEKTYRYTTCYTTFNEPKPNNENFYECNSEPNFNDSTQDNNNSIKNVNREKIDYLIKNDYNELKFAKIKYCNIKYHHHTISEKTWAATLRKLLECISMDERINLCKLCKINAYKNSMLFKENLNVYMPSAQIYTIFKEILNIVDSKNMYIKIDITLKRGGYISYKNQ
tara:strand:- start:693 stop:1553 length:861 start_codon:yes stop_codon:yes gene_type:complete